MSIFNILLQNQSNETVRGNYFNGKINDQSTLNVGCDLGKMESCQNIDSKEHLKHLIGASINSPSQSKEIVRDNYSKDKINDHSSLNAGSEMFAMACDQDVDSKEHLKHLIGSSNELLPQTNKNVRGNFFKGQINDQSTLNVGGGMGEKESSQDIDSKEHLKHLIGASINFPPQSNETVDGNYSKDKINDQATLNVGCSVFDLESSQDIDSKEHLKQLIGASINFPPQSNEAVHGNYFKDKIKEQSILTAGSEQVGMACDQDTDSKEHLKRLIAVSIHLPPQSKEIVRSNYFKDKTSHQMGGNTRFQIVCTENEGSEECHQYNNTESFCLPSTSNQTVQAHGFTGKRSNKSKRNANCEMSERAYAKGESSYEHLKLPSSGSFHLPSSNEIILGNNFDDKFVDQSIEPHEMCEVIFREGKDVEKPKSILFAGALPSILYRGRKSANNGLLVNPLPYCEEMPRCEICGKMFFSENELKSHFGTHYKKYSYSAHNKVIPQSKILVDRTRVRKSSLRGVSSSEESHFKLQEKSRAKQTSYVCFFCRKSFTEFKDLDEHVKYHRRKEPYSCIFCKEVFGLVSELEIHERTHVIEQRYSCYYCESKFARHRELKEHLLVHTGKKAFVCMYCNKKCLCLSHLKTHMMSACRVLGHTGRPKEEEERPARGCPKRTVEIPVRGHPKRAGERPARGRPKKALEKPTRGRGRPKKGLERPTRGRGRPKKAVEKPARGPIVLQINGVSIQ
ncbi:zinc finger protein 112-like [Uloborus diversus]|uniref:zinc finger protein 112-like n=1 Tax=Uloborus diversus TaxID=327109 RepID=UPI00240A86ED|nr:zinc finger protein 112-like [Uloborus diversus]